jgi:orotidine-5'-phosphate decarboxylase
MNFHDRLRSSAQRAGHILCLGIDPDLDRLNLSLEQFAELVDQLLEEVQPAAIKPNSAYFEALGSPGWIWLEHLIERWRGRCPIILDVKRGDIGPSSRAYARSAFDRLKVDAVTVNPWMGRDSLAPFADYAPQHGFYTLVRTSNSGHADLQKLNVGGQELWQKLLIDLPCWFAGAGAVVGATSISDLTWTCQNLAPNTPLLIPGVGSQGGEAHQVLAQLRSTEVELHRVNVSSKILFAVEDFPELSPLMAARKAFAIYAEQLKL